MMPDSSGAGLVTGVSANSVSTRSSRRHKKNRGAGTEVPTPHSGRSYAASLDVGEQVVDAAFGAGQGFIDGLVAIDGSADFFADDVLDRELALDGARQRAAG